MQYPRVQAKGASEVEVLYREHRDRLWRAVFLFCRDREMASDSVAEAFAQALRNEKTIRSVLPWVWRAAFAIAAGELKRRGRVTTAKDPRLIQLTLRYMF